MRRHLAIVPALNEADSVGAAVLRPPFDLGIGGAMQSGLAVFVGLFRRRPLAAPTESPIELVERTA
jgi:hypothetical protein